MNSLFTQIRNFFSTGHARSIRAKKNVALSLLIKLIQIGVRVALVPLMLKYLGDETYGVWLTVMSTILWFEFFDVGLGHGLRNKLGEAMAQDNTILARQYVSTAFAVIGIIAATFSIVAVAINGFVNWSRVLNTNVLSPNESAAVVLIVTIGFSVRLAVNLIFPILYASQMPAMKNLINAAARLGILLYMVGILWFGVKSKLFYVALIFMGIPALTSIVFSVYFFSTRLRHIRPAPSFIKPTLLKPLMGLGGKFFILQVCATVVYSTDNMIISHLFTPASVVPYEVAHKYFAMMLMMFGIVVQPVWSAVTEAQAKGDIAWIKRSVKRLIQLWLVSVLGLLLMLFLSPLVYDFWLSGEIKVPVSLSVIWALFIAVQALNSIFVQVINGVGKVRVQMLVAIGGAVINIPLSIYLAGNMGMGVSGVIMATLATQVVAIVFVAIQYQKFISGQLSGIWNN